MFTVDALLVKSKNGRKFKLVTSFAFISKLFGGLRIDVPEGAESDGASTPWFIWFFLPPFGWYWMEAYLHDYLYRYSDYPKWMCDRLFLEAMEHNKRHWLIRYTLYYGVKFGGQKAFNSDRKHRK